MFSVSFLKELHLMRATAASFTVGGVRYFELPFFSENTVIPSKFFENNRYRGLP